MLKVQSLNYKVNALLPVIGAETMLFHHDKHYQGYVAKANELTPKQWQNKTLEQLIVASRKEKNTALFHQAAQVWNHEFFFQGLQSESDASDISEALSDCICQDYQDLEHLNAELIRCAVAHFGSGWVWLVSDNGHLRIFSTSNADTPCGVKNIIPLWTLDVWEHAYYLDYQNRRIDYATQVVHRLMNWRVISERLKV